jgi:hypothetical protein
VTAPEPRTIVRHRSNAARRYPVAVAMLFLLASVPMLAAVLVGSASLDGKARPRTPFVAGPPGNQVVIPGEADPSDPDHALRPLDASPLPAGDPDRTGLPPGKAPVRTGHVTPIVPPVPAGGSVVGGAPAGSGSGPGSSGGTGNGGSSGGGGTGTAPGGGFSGGGNTGSDPAGSGSGSGGTPTTPAHGHPECSTPPPTAGPERRPTPSPKPSPSRTDGGLVGGLLGGVVGLIS